jgi:hypothetical protein
LSYLGLGRDCPVCRYMPLHGHAKDRCDGVVEPDRSGRRNCVTCKQYPWRGSAENNAPGSLKQTSFIIHYLGWQAERGFGHLPEMEIIRPCESFDFFP